MANSFQLGAKSWAPPDQAAAEEFVAYSKEWDAARSLEQFDLVVSSAAGYISGEAIGKTFRNLLREKIVNRRPASFIRLGDADGNALFYMLKKYPALAKYCLRKISTIYFGNEDLMVDHSDFFSSMVVEAVENADGIGGPERETVRASFEKPYPDLDVRGMCGMRGVYNYFATSFDLSRLKGALWSSTWYSRALLPHYFNLLRDLPFVGFITCYADLASLVQQQTGIKQVETIAVPMQASIAFQTKREKTMKKDIGHYPGVFPRILEAIKPPHEGAVYIIAAGILSKAYCTRVKQLGGISIDIGSVADVWMNTRSRPDMPANFMERWSLKRA